jgi:hypothetical protein
MTRNFECRLGRLEARARVGGVIVAEWRSAADDESLALARPKSEAQGALLIVIHDPWAAEVAPQAIPPVIFPATGCSQECSPGIRINFAPTK